MSIYSRTVRIVLAILVGAIGLSPLFFTFETVRYLTLSSQEDGALITRQLTTPGDILVFNWIHSFEHIPWVEEYTVEEDNTFILHTLKVAGFGAGIPESKGKVSVVDGMVVMQDIEETFPYFVWINSQTALVSITIHGELFIQGSQLPHHQKLKLTIEGKRTLCPRFLSKPQIPN